MLFLTVVICWSLIGLICWSLFISKFCSLRNLPNIVGNLRFNLPKYSRPTTTLKILHMQVPLWKVCHLRRISLAWHTAVHGIFWRGNIITVRRCSISTKVASIWVTYTKCKHVTISPISRTAGSETKIRAVFKVVLLCNILIAITSLF